MPLLTTSAAQRCGQPTRSTRRAEEPLDSEHILASPTQIASTDRGIVSQGFGESRDCRTIARSAMRLPDSQSSARKRSPGPACAPVDEWRDGRAFSRPRSSPRPLGLTSVVIEKRSQDATDADERCRLCNRRPRTSRSAEAVAPVAPAARTRWWQPLAATDRLNAPRVLAGVRLDS